MTYTDEQFWQEMLEYVRSLPNDFTPPPEGPKFIIEEVDGKYITRLNREEDKCTPMRAH